MKTTIALRQTVLGLIALVFLSCTANNRIELNSTGGGIAHFEIALAPYLSEVILQFEALMGEDVDQNTNHGFFDLEAIRADFSQNPKVQLLELENPSELQLKGSLSFENLEDLASDAVQNSGASSEAQNLFKIEQSEASTYLEVRLDRESMEAFLGANPAFDNPLMANFGPGSTEGISESDYLDMMGFALGEESQRGIVESILRLDIRVDGEVISQSGGKKLNTSTVRFDIPLIAALMLDEPRVYSLEYR
ncbi:MAG: hypothetical protein MI717_14900 [Spirochaetales bacterium]|nr:hypothetical protein [Spirochaetales bacterium]